MLFKEYHIPMIRSGSKTVTRREWDENYPGPNVGTVVAAKTDMLKPDDECDCFIRIVGKYEQPLGEMTDADAQKEGDYETMDEFREAYEDVYGEGSWVPGKVVTVVEFEYLVHLWVKRQIELARQGERPPVELEADDRAV